MATKTATGNGQTLKALVATDTTYSSGGFSGVILDFSDPSVNPPFNVLTNINSMTLLLADPAISATTSSNSVSFGSTTVNLTLDRITAVKGSADDDTITYTFNAPRTGTAYTVYASEGNDTYGLYGNSTLTYAGYATALTVNFKLGSVDGKTGGAGDLLTTTPNNVVLTNFDDTVLLDATKTVGLVDGGLNGTAGDLISWANFSATGVTVSLDNQLDDSGNTFTNFEQYKGSSGDDVFAVATAVPTGYTLLATEGNDTYQANGKGTLSYAGYAVTSSPTVGLQFNLKLGSVNGKNGGATDLLTGTIGAMVGTDHNDTFMVDASKTVGSIDAGAGTDLLKFVGTTGATVNLNAGTATGITGTFSNFETYMGSGGGDNFTATTATGFTIFASAGSDIYDLNGHGTLSYAGTTSPLSINLSAGVVTGKQFASDSINGLAPSIIGSDGNDVFTAKSTGNETLDGGLGNDVLHVSWAKADYTFFSNNNDGSGILSKAGQTIHFSNFESVVFTDATNVLTTTPQDDFFGAGRSGTFWRAADGDVWIWNNNGTGVDAYTHTVGSVAPVWSVVGAGDFGGDGKADVLFHNTSNGEVYLWNMNGGSIASQGDVTSSGLNAFLDPAVWHGLGVRDFDGDGHADVLWQTTTGLVYEWSMNGNAIINQGTVGNAPADIALSGGGTSSFHVLGFGEVNGDGKTDVVWYNAAAGAIEYWYMDGHTYTAKDVTFSPTLLIDGVGDFNGDGIADLIGHDAAGNFAIGTLGKNTAGVGTGSVVSLDVVATIDPTIWSIKQVNDYNGDGKADVLFTSTTGDVWIWEMSGSTIIGQGSAGHIDPAANWTLYS